MQFDAKVSHDPHAAPLQMVVLVPHMELGVQTALLIFKLLGGNLSQGRPGDPANMFSYFGPKGIKVCAPAQSPALHCILRSSSWAFLLSWLERWQWNMAGGG